MIEYAIDCAKVNSSMWHAIVIRNLPESMKESKLEEILKGVVNSIRYVMPIMKIKSISFIKHRDALR